MILRLEGVRSRFPRSHFEANFSPEDSMKHLLTQIESNKLVQCRNCALLPTCNNPTKGLDEGCNTGSSLSFTAWSEVELQQHLSHKKDDLSLASKEPQKKIEKPLE